MKHLIFPLLGVSVVVLVYFFVPTSAVNNYYPSDCCCNRTHNFFYGRRSPYDRLLYTNHTYVPARLYRKSSVDVVFPAKWQPTRGSIRRIEVLDSYRDGLGACAYLKRGGPGYRNATITLISSVSHPINSIINVYG